MEDERDNVGAAFQEPKTQEVKMTLKWFNGAKGFGFVVPEDGSFDAFIHITTLQQVGVHNVGEGAILRCSIFDGPKGKQVKDVIEIIDKGQPSTVPVLDPDTNLLTMGGLVKWFKQDKGFGFVIPDDGMKDVFVHQSCLDRNEIETLHAGQRVKISLKDVDKGREAVTIEIIDQD